MKDYIKIGIERNLISFNEDKSRITYVFQKKERNYNNPEEKVQAETFLRLILDYNYPENRIRQFVSVTMGREVKEADIVVYEDDMCVSPHILVECKREEVSEAEYQQAIEQAYSYAFALPCDVKYVWVTSGIKSDYFEVDKNQNTRNQLPDIPQFGVKDVASYKYVYGAQYLPEEAGKQRFFDLSVIDQSELTRRFKQAHEALWAGGQLNPSEAFDELDKLIFCKIWDERKPRRMGEPYDFQIITVPKDVEKSESKRRLIENDNLYKRVIALYEEGRKKDEEVFRDNIRLTPEKIRTVVSYLESVNLGETDLDSKGRAFETFMGSFFRGNFGQYFTPREIVKFIVDVLPIEHDSKVLDTSCGSGGFLLYALNKVRNNATELYPNYKTDTRQYKHWFSYWHNFAEKNLYGIEISEQISRAAKMNMIIHDDGHTNVITSDGLLADEVIIAKTKNQKPRIQIWNLRFHNNQSESAFFYLINSKAEALTSEENLSAIFNNESFSTTLKAELLSISEEQVLCIEELALFLQQSHIAICGDAYFTFCLKLTRFVGNISLKQLQKSIICLAAEYEELGISSIEALLVLLKFLVEGNKKDYGCFAKWIKSNEVGKVAGLSHTDLIGLYEHIHRQREYKVFVAMPYISFKRVNDFNNLFKDVLKEISEKKVQAKVSLIPIMRFKGNSQRIDSRLIKCIKECDIFIADLTTCNDNVIFEVGLAEGNNKPMILIKAESDTTKLPFDEAELKLSTQVPFDMDKLQWIPYSSSGYYTDIKNIMKNNIPEILKENYDVPIVE